MVAVGDIVPADNLAYLLKYDSSQGRFQGKVSSKKSSADKAEDDGVDCGRERNPGGERQGPDTRRACRGNN